MCSDGCSYQNRNVVLSNALLNVAMNKQISIVQKYLERGHTNMEVDSMHSPVERRIKKKPIYLPQHVDAIISARPNQPMSVKYLSHEFFKDMTKLTNYSSSRIQIEV